MELTPQLIASVIAALFLGGVAAILAFFRLAGRARFPRGLPSEVRFAGQDLKLKAFAETLHAAVRRDVERRIDCDTTDVPKYRARVLELAEHGLVVSCGVHRGGGPVRLLLELRVKGDNPGRRFVIIVRRSSKKPTIELSLRASGPKLMGVPRNEAELVVAAVSRSLQDVPNISDIEWSEDGNAWRRQPNASADLPRV